MTRRRPPLPRRRIRRGRPPGGDEARVLLPGLLRARAEAELSTDALRELVQRVVLGGRPGPLVGSGTLRGWESGAQSAPRWVLPYIAGALECEESVLTEAPPARP